MGEIILSSSLARILSNTEWLRHRTGYYQEPGRKAASNVITHFFSWLSRRDPQRPFFAFINLNDGHTPYLPPPPYDSMFGTKQLRKNARHSLGWNWSLPEIQAEINAYDGCIAYLDDQLGKLFGELENHNLLTNTLIIITSDHGEEFFEHGVMDHGYSLYFQSLHVPLLIFFSGVIPREISVPDPVSLQDIPATIMDLLKVKSKVVFHGESLARHWNGRLNPSVPETDTLASEVRFRPDVLKSYPLFKGNMQSLVNGRYHYIKNGDGHEELYDFEEDPLEKNDLVQSEQGRQILGRLRTSFEKLLLANRNKR